jgi:DNA polymerase/3'-5' exonuclease PolX
MNNQLIIDNLTTLFHQYRLSNDPTVSRFKANVISKLINVVKSYKGVIKSGNDLQAIKGVGKGSITRINEILETSTLKEINHTKNYTVYSELEKITGIGKVKAKSLVVNNGVTSIDNLRDKLKSNKIKLTHHIIIGLKYFEDINKRIPIKEMNAINKYIKDIINKNFESLVYTICGSYRRGLSSSGDIDILISDSRCKTDIYKHKYLEKLINILHETKFIIDNLTTSGSTKYMGICKLYGRKIARRIDIRCINYNSYYTGLLYFTGSRQLNINMRNKALDNGYKLNEYFVYDISKKKKIYPCSEKEIFELCNMEYLEPTERDIH